MFSVDQRTSGVEKPEAYQISFPAFRGSYGEKRTRDLLIDSALEDGEYRYEV